MAAFDADRLTVVSVSNPSSPSVVGSVYSTSLNGIRWIARAPLDSTKLLVTSKWANTFCVIDVATPSSPTLGACIVDNTYLKHAFGLDVKSNRAYAVNEYYETTLGQVTLSSHFVVISISDFSAPVIIGKTWHKDQLRGAKGLVVRGSYAYVCASAYNSITIVDISNGAAGQPVSAVLSAARHASPYPGQAPTQVRVPRSSRLSRTRPTSWGCTATSSRSRAAR